MFPLHYAHMAQMRIKEVMLQGTTLPGVGRVAACGRVGSSIVQGTNLLIDKRYQSQMTLKVSKCSPRPGSSRRVRGRTMVFIENGTNPFMRTVIK